MVRNLTLNINSDKIVKGLKDIDTGLKKTNKQGKKTTDALQKSTEATTKRFNALKVSIGGVFSLMAVSSFSKTIGEFQALNRSLGVVFGSAERGTAVFRDLERIALSTPFSIQALSNSVIKLRASGIEPTNEQLALFADVASVTTDKLGTLNAMTDLFSRTTAGGLGLEDLNRLADRGIPVFDILSQKMGLARLEVAKFGQSADGAQQILKVLTDEMQNRFGGAAKDSAEDLTVSISNMGIAWDGMQKSLGDAGGMVLASGIVTGLTATIVFFSENLDTLAIGMGVLSTLAIPAMIGGIKALGVAIAANPIGLLVTVLAGVSMAAWHFRDDIHEALLKTFTVSIPNAIDHTIIAFKSLKGGFGDAMNGILEKFNEFGNNMISKLPDWVKKMFGIDNKTFSLGIDIAKVNSEIDVLEQTIANRLANFKKPPPLFPSAEEAGGDVAGLQSGSLTGNPAVVKAENNALAIEQEITHASVMLGLKADYEANLTRQTEEGEKARRELQAQGLGAAAGIFSGLSQLMAREGKKQSGIQKALAKAAIVASTAQAIMNALAVPPYPLGVALAAGAALQGAKQLSMVGGGGSSGSAGLTPVSSAVPLSATPIASPINTIPQERGTTTIILDGNFYGWDDQVIDDLVTGIASAVDDRDVQLISPTSRNAQDLAEAA